MTKSTLLGVKEPKETVLGQRRMHVNQPNTPNRMIAGVCPSFSLKDLSGLIVTSTDHFRF